MNGRFIALTMWHNLLSVICKVSSCEHIERLRDKHLDFLEHIFMSVSYRSISDLEPVKDGKRCSGNLGKIFTKYLRGTSFSSKVKIRGMPYRL